MRLFIIMVTLAVLDHFGIDVLDNFFICVAIFGAIILATAADVMDALGNRR